MQRILVTGASGFVGRRIVRELKNRGYKVIVLTRSTVSAAMVLGTDIEYIEWKDYHTVPDLIRAKVVDAVINLMGENISSKRWNTEQKKIMNESRILSTQNLIQGLERLEVKPKVFLSASAVGFYGDKKGERVDENQSAGDDYLAKLCSEWEKVVLDQKNKFDRVAFFRIGVVFGKGGGALNKMLPIFKLGAGGPIGDGSQFMSWIHVDDLARMMVEALQNNLYQGPINAVAPFPVTNKEFSHALAKLLRKPVLLSTPKFMMEIIMGEASCIVTNSLNAANKKVKSIGFHYQHPTVELALKDVLSK